MARNIDFNDPAIVLNADAHEIACPDCGFTCNHFDGPPQHLQGEEDWFGRGDLLLIPFAGECGSKWGLLLGHHKGATMLGSRVFKSCKQDAPHMAREGSAAI